jgi:GDP-4-dehydro-6-deoxy-D-mannose reductase
MRILVTGATGFVGRWLRVELERAGHEVVAAPSHRELDLAALPDLRSVITDARPDAVAHLAAVSFGPDASKDPELAVRVNAGGTRALFSGLDAVGSTAAVLVTSSSEVYGHFDPADLPLNELQPPRATAPYGKSKIAQETVSMEAAARGRSVTVTRAFNHIGPGQREVFVAPALARRVLALRDGNASAIRAGNLDVRRDFGDVRDVVRAYRLLLESLVEGRIPSENPVYNIATGRSVPIRELVEILCRLAGVQMSIEVDPALVRTDDPPDIRGDSSALRELTGWRPAIALESSLADLLESLERPNRELDGD